MDDAIMYLNCNQFEKERIRLMTKRFAKCLLALTICLLLFCVQIFAEGELWDETNPAQTALQEAAGAESENAQTLPFPDVQKNCWYYDDLFFLYQNGVIGGYTDGMFHGDLTVTSGQALKMILLASGYEKPQPVESHWARSYLDLAIEEGIVERFVDITDLDAVISRALIAKISAVSLGLDTSEAGSAFSDTNDGFSYALQKEAILRGFPDGSFRPKNSMTRAELVCVTARILRWKAGIEELKRENEEAPEEEEDIQLKTTDQGIELIKSFEGFVEKAYWDYAQYSIGYGSRCEKNEYPDGITKEQADRLLRKNVVQIEKELDAFEAENGLDFSPTQYDALVSLTYNIGSQWMKSRSASRLAALLAGGNYTNNELASAMGIWCHVTENGKSVIFDVLVLRRMREIKLFLYGDYSGGSSTQICWVKYLGGGGSPDVDIAMYEKGTTCAPFYGAAKSGVLFLGWQDTQSGEMLTRQSVITDNVTVKALWDEDSGEDEQESEDEEDGEESGWGGFWY